MPVFSKDKKTEEEKFTSPLPITTTSNSKTYREIKFICFACYIRHKYTNKNYKEQIL